MHAVPHQMRGAAGRGRGAVPRHMLACADYAATLPSRACAHRRWEQLAAGGRCLSGVGLACTGPQASQGRASTAQCGRGLAVHMPCAKACAWRAPLWFVMLRTSEAACVHLYTNPANLCWLRWLWRSERQHRDGCYRPRPGSGVDGLRLRIWCGKSSVVGRAACQTVMGLGHLLPGAGVPVPSVTYA